MKRLNSVLGIGLLGVMMGIASMSMAACGDDDDDAAGSGGGSGKGGSSGTGGTSGTGGSSGTGGGGGSAGAGGGGGSAGSGGGAGSAGAGGAGGGGLSLYDRLGGKSTIRGFVGGEVAKVAGNATFSKYFTDNVSNPPKAGHPSPAQITECFSRLLGSAINGPGEVYPGDPVADGSLPAHTCRGMKASHIDINLGITEPDFDLFVSTLAGDLVAALGAIGGGVVANPTKLGEISQAEADAIVGTLNATKNDIVQPD